MDKASQILFTAFFLLIIVAVSALYYKSFITEDYEKTFADQKSVEIKNSTETP